MLTKTTLTSYGPDASLAILDDERQSIATPTPDDLAEYVVHGTIRGRRHTIGVTWTEGANYLAVSLTRGEVASWR